MDKDKAYISDKLLIDNPLYMNTIPFDTLEDCVKSFLTDSEYKTLLKLSKPYIIYSFDKDNNMVPVESSRRYLVKQDLMNFFLVFVEDYYKVFNIYQMKNKSLIQNTFLNLLKMRRKCDTFSKSYDSMFVGQFSEFPAVIQGDEPFQVNIADCSRMLEDDLPSLIGSAAFFDSINDSKKSINPPEFDFDVRKNYVDLEINPTVDVNVSIERTNFINFCRKTHDKKEYYSKVVKKIYNSSISEVLDLYINLLNKKMINIRNFSNVCQFKCGISLEEFVSLFLIDPLETEVKNIYSKDDINFVRVLLHKVLNNEVINPDEIERILDFSQFYSTPVELNCELFQTYLNYVKKLDLEKTTESAKSK